MIIILFQTELELIGMGIANSIIIFPISIYIIRWYSKKKDRPHVQLWDTSLKTAFKVSLIWLMINIPIGILFNLFVKVQFFVIQFFVYQFFL